MSRAKPDNVGDKYSYLDKFLTQEPDTITLEAYKRRESGDAIHALPNLERRERAY